MRVLHLLPEDTVGGAELMVASVAEGLDPRLVESEIATLQPPGPLARRSESARTPVHSLGGHGWLAAAWRLVKLLRSRRFHVLAAYGFKASMLGRMLVKLVAPRTAFVCGVRGEHVTTVVGLDSPRSRAVLCLERLASPLVDRYDVNSLDTVDLLAESGIARNRLRYIPYGIDTSRWQPRPSGDADGEPTVVCVARFVPLKRHVDLLQAIRKLRTAGVPCRAVLVGGGPTLEETRAARDGLGLGEVVRLPGELTQGEVARLLAESQVFCLPSVSEGMPSSILEAMASGLPVVACDIRGVRTLVIPGETGVLVPPYDPDGLAAALQTLLTDPRRAQAYGAAGRRRVEESFGIEETLARTENLYLELSRDA